MQSSNKLPLDQQYLRELFVQFKLSPSDHESRTAMYTLQQKKLCMVKIAIFFSHGR